MTEKELQPFSITEYGPTGEAGAFSFQNEEEAWDKYRSEIFGELKVGGRERMIVLKRGTHIVSTFAIGL